MNYVKSLILKFDIPLRQSEITKFRGAVVASLENKDILFHNHSKNGLRYSYPLIQYKTINQKAAIVCFGDGTEAITSFFEERPIGLTIGKDKKDLHIEKITNEKTPISISDDKTSTYRIRNWLPLNDINYKKYIGAESLAERILLLEAILKGNILSALKGLDTRIDETMRCSITNVSRPKIIKYKGVDLLGFDIEFKTNISLPQHLGLGKHCSVGFGNLTLKEC